MDGYSTHLRMHASLSVAAAAHSQIHDRVYQPEGQSHMVQMV